MNLNREIAYRIDPALWVRMVLGVTPTAWQEQFLRARRGASILVLTARQVGKTTAAAWAMTHTALFEPGSLSVVACPAQRQSAEAVRKVRDVLHQCGAKIVTDNVFGLELANGARVLALPGSDDSIRGLTVDGWIIADEAAQLKLNLMSALRPMRARRPKARLAMLSTAWSRIDPFWSAWESSGDWMRIKATVDEHPSLFPQTFLDDERVNLGEEGYKREYLGIPAGGHVSPFTWHMYERATQSLPSAIFDFPKPVFMAHDVARGPDRSTAVCGGVSPLAPELITIGHIEELPLGLSGYARAEALSPIDRRHNSQTLIIPDLSSDETYGEVLFERYGPRMIGVRISRHGDGLKPEWRQVKGGGFWLYTVGRTYLFDLLYREMLIDKVRLLKGPDSLRAYEQLMALERENRDTGLRYSCPSNRHDDLAISCAMLVWAARHPHVSNWCRVLEPRRPSIIRPAPSAAGWT